MTYLLHPSSSYVASPSRGGGDVAGGRGGGPLSVLLHGVRSILHGEPSHVARASNSSVDGGTGGAQCFQGCRKGQLPARCSNAGASQLTRASGTAGHGDISVPSSGATSSWPTSASVVHPTSSKTRAYFGGSGARIGNTTATDAILYEHAVQYSDLEEVLRCPLPPVPGCPTPCAFGKCSADMNGNGGVFTAETVSLPPLSSSSSSPPPPLKFRCIAADPETGISLYSTPVEDCPMHLMRAYAVLPCAPRDVLQYMDNTLRPKWDSHLRRGALLRELTPPAQTKGLESPYLLSSFITSGATLAQQSPTSLSAQSQVRPRQLPSSAVGSTDSVGGECGRAAVSDPTLAAASSPSAFRYLPGQRRVAIHYLETRTPVPLVQDRDFEIVAAEEVRCDGAAYMKAFSTPLGYHTPLDPHQSRYVRAVVLFSGMVARPIDPASLGEVLPPVLMRHYQSESKHRTTPGDDVKKKRLRASPTVSADAAADTAPRQYCVMEYVGLVHPMGLLPAVLVNMVISAQLNAIRRMQRFIMQSPLSSLRPTSVEPAPAKRMTCQPLKELSGTLQSPVDSSRKSQQGDMSLDTVAVKRGPGTRAGAANPPLTTLAASHVYLWWRRQRHRFLSHL